MHQIYTNVVMVQLLKVNLPDAYENAIVMTQVEVQKRRMNQYAQNVTRIQSDISVLRSITNANITLINSTAEATAYTIGQTAYATARNNTI